MTPHGDRERITLDEMQRLMQLYGSVKRHRRRGIDAKDVSVKRKFGRWFPDLDERFEREEGTGRFMPKIGHEAEVRYREEMRRKDGEPPSKKPEPYRERITLDEMQRLMRVYGSTKCLRRRSRDTKADSIKRKFGRWFPDLDERFEQDEGTGRFVPKIGHVAEVRYREEMRARDAWVAGKKRADARKKNNPRRIKEWSGKKAAVAPAPAAAAAATAKSGQGAEMELLELMELVPVGEETTVSPDDLTLTLNPRCIKEWSGEKAAKSATTATAVTLETAAAAAAAAKSERGTEMEVSEPKESVSVSEETTVSLDDLALSLSYPDAEEEEERGALPAVIQFEIGLGLEVGAAEEDPPEDPFVAGEGIFDDVEERFFEPPPSLGDAAASHSRKEYSGLAARRDTAAPSALGPGLVEKGPGSDGSIVSNGSWEMDLALISGTAEKTIEECCEEILGPEDDCVFAPLPCWADDRASLLKGKIL